MEQNLLTYQELGEQKCGQSKEQKKPAFFNGGAQQTLKTHCEVPELGGQKSEQGTKAAGLDQSSV